MHKRNGFTLVEVIIMSVIIFVLCVVGIWGIRGCGAQLSDNLIVNPLHSSIAKIKVLATYFASNETRNIYRVYATVIEDSDGNVCGTGEGLIECPRETFEIGDSFIDGNYRTADHFGELRSSAQTGRVFEVNLRGERSGVSGSMGTFREIHSITEGEAE